MVKWFRGHVVAQKLALYLFVAGLAASASRDAGTAVFLTLAFVLSDRWIFTFLPPRWDQQRVRVAPDWLILGLLVGCGVTLPLWIGVFPLGVAAAVANAKRADLKRTLDSGLPLGLAPISAWLAWVNRGGPGTVCPGGTAAGKCATYLAPWPFALAAVVFVLLAVAVELRRSKSAARQA